MTDDRDDLLWLGASLCRAKDRAAAAERRVVELEAAIAGAVSLLEYPATVQAANSARCVLVVATTPQDAPGPPTLPEPVPDRPEAPGLPCGHRDRSLCGPECVGRLRVKLPDP